MAVFSNGHQLFLGLHMSWPQSNVLTCGLACRALQGQYKWLLYGDDDTIWFVNGVLELAGNLDSTLPYIVTGLQVHFESDGSR